MDIITLRNGIKMPCLGLGTHRMTESDLEYIIPIALDLGYRLFDTAVGYRNEIFLGQILSKELKKRHLLRSSVYITSKLKPIDHGYESTVQSILQSAEYFEGYVDLYLIHWPGVAKLAVSDPRNVLLRNDSWKALQDVYRAGQYVRAIGVSNYTINHLVTMRTTSEGESEANEGTGENEGEFIWPMVNQYELHPSYHPTDLIDFCQTQGIHLQSYSTLGTGELLTQEFSERYPFLEQMREKYAPLITQMIREQQLTQYFTTCTTGSGRSEEMIVTLSPSSLLACLYLAWARQSSFSVIPKSLNPSHLCLNLLSTSLVLTEEEMTLLNQIQDDSQRKICWDPSKVI